jgi:glutamine synthetase
MDWLLRSPDPAANPYLALAVCLRAGLWGIRNKIMPPSPVRGNVAALSAAERAELGVEQLPATLIEALNEFDKDDFIRESLGNHVCAKYIEAKKREWEEYSEQVSEWEIRQYLNKI